MINTVLNALPQAPQLISDPTIQPVATTEENVEICFYDNTKIYIKKSWYDRYPVFQNTIYRTYDKFSKYIMPILANYNLEFLQDFDEQHEIGVLIDEINYYDIQLTEQQIIQITDACKFSSKIADVKHVIDNSNGFFKQNIRNRLKQFGGMWDSLINLYADKHHNEKLKQLTYELIITTMKSQDYYCIGRLNIKYSNIIYRFLVLFNDYVIHNNDKSLIKFKFELSVDVGSNMSELINDGIGLVRNIISSIPGLNKEQQTIATSLLAQASSIKSLLS